MRNTHTQVNRQASVARILLQVFLEYFLHQKKIFFRCTNKRKQYKIINYTKHI